MWPTLIGPNHSTLWVKIELCPYVHGNAWGWYTNWFAWGDSDLANAESFYSLECCNICWCFQSQTWNPDNNNMWRNLWILFCTIRIFQHILENDWKEQLSQSLTFIYVGLEPTRANIFQIGGSEWARMLIPAQTRVLIPHVFWCQKILCQLEAGVPVT